MTDEQFRVSKMRLNMLKHAAKASQETARQISEIAMARPHAVWQHTAGVAGAIARDGRERYQTALARARRG